VIKKLYWYLFVYDLNPTAAKPAERVSISIKQRLLKDISLIVLFAYSLLTFNTSIPVIADAFAHTFFEKEHLAHEHKLNGKNHVQNEISKTEKESGQSKSHSKTINDDFTHVLCVAPIISYPLMMEIRTVYPVFQYTDCDTYPSSFYPPPRA
jgi:hypothetical protein